MKIKVLVCHEHYGPRYLGPIINDEDYKKAAAIILRDRLESTGFYDSEIEKQAREHLECGMPAAWLRKRSGFTGERVELIDLESLR